MSLNTAQPVTDLLPDHQAMECLHLLWQAALKVKALQVAAFDVRSRTPLMDYVLLCNGRSQMHVRGIGEQMLSTLKEAQQPCQGVEGMTEGSWLLLDCGLVLAHVFHPDTRHYYDLDSLLAECPRCVLGELPIEQVQLISR